MKRNLIDRLWAAVLHGDAEPPKPEVREPTRAQGLARETLWRALQGPPSRERTDAFVQLFAIPKPSGNSEGEQAAYSAIDSMMTPILRHVADNAVGPVSAYGYGDAGAYGEGIGFMGYPYLAELTQRAEYRVISEIHAQEMTRKWIELTYDGDAKGEDKLKAIEQWMDEHRVQAAFRKVKEQDGFFGRSQIYIDTGATDKVEELKTRLVYDKAKMKKGMVKAIRVIEPLWTYPNAYNAADPLKPDYYRPQSWFVQGKLVHSSRLMTFVSREMPDLLKASYAFGGLAMSQMEKPYIDNWLRTRQSVSDLIQAFSTMVLKTNMGAVLQGGSGQSLFDRIDMFNATRNNRGAMAIDKDSEELENIAVPLGTLDKLQAQSQEHMAGIGRLPLIKLFGITPTGLNATSDGEIRTLYDSIHAEQEHLYRVPIQTVLKIAQLDLFGEIDEAVGFKFRELWELDEAAKAAISKTKIDGYVELVTQGIVSPEEIRTVISDDPESDFADIDPADVPEPEMEDGENPSILADPSHSAEPKKEMRSGV